MLIRLPHLLAGLALILLAGLAAVVVLESRAGGAAVPGMVLLDQRGLDEAQMAELARALPGSRVEWVLAAETPLAPFSAEGHARLRSQGYTTLLLVPSGEAPDWQGWDERTRPASYRVTPQQGLADMAREDLAHQIRTHQGTRPSFLALVSETFEVAALVQICQLAQLELAAQPSFRRSSLVVLGAREAGRRLALRLDIGRWGGRSQPALADLLDPGW